MNKINKITNKFIKGKWKFNQIDKNYEFYKEYKKINSNTNINYNNILNNINNSELTNYYIKIMNNYNPKIINQSDIHGLSHIIRTSIFILILSTFENINIDDFKIVLESILYHDIGRTNDIDDDNHGYEATKKITFLKEQYNEEEYSLISSLITAHWLDDELYVKIARYYNIKDTKRFHKLLCIIKDADALDRVREYPYVDIKFLRTNYSKKLLPFAYELFYNYEINTN